MRLPFGTGRHAPIAAEDQARVIAKVLLAPDEHKGKVYPLYGGKEYTFSEIATEIGKVIGKPVGYEQVDAWTLKKLAANSPRRNHTNTLWQHFQEIAKDHQNGVFAGTNDLVEKIGGKRPIGRIPRRPPERVPFLSLRTKGKQVVPAADLRYRRRSLRARRVRRRDRRGVLPR